MKVRAMMAALAAAMAFTFPAVSAEAQQRRAAAQDWTRTVVATPEGGYRMGNPNAEIRIVEFLSLTCPHCRDFAVTGMPQLMPQIRSGRVSIEYRNFVLNQLDLAAAMLSRCAPTARYFALSDAILAGQDAWVPRVSNMIDESATTPASAMQHLGRVVSTSGLDQLAQRHGITPARASACMADQRGLDRLIAMRQAGEALGVGGTPSFLVNGRLAQGVHDWSRLAPLIAPRR